MLVSADYLSMVMTATLNEELLFEMATSAL